MEHMEYEIIIPMMLMADSIPIASILNVSPFLVFGIMNSFQENCLVHIVHAFLMRNMEHAHQPAPARTSNSNACLSTPCCLPVKNVLWGNFPKCDSCFGGDYRKYADIRCIGHIKFGPMLKFHLISLSKISIKRSFPLSLYVPTNTWPSVEITTSSIASSRQIRNGDVLLCGKSQSRIR